jgi:hypothetical protein
MMAVFRLAHLTCEPVFVASGKTLNLASEGLVSLHGTSGLRCAALPHRLIDQCMLGALPAPSGRSFCTFLP